MLQRLSKVLRVPLPRADQGARGGQGRPADAGHVKAAVHEDQVAYLLERQPEFPGVAVADTLPAQLPAPGARRAGPRLRRRDHARSELEATRGRRLPRRRRRSARPASRRRTTRTCAARRAPRSSASTRSAGRMGRSTTERPPSRATALRLTIDIALQRAAERALRYGIDLAHAERRVGRERRRDRRARPARRRGARDGVEPDLQAARLRRPRRPEEARAARSTDGREGAELPGPQPRARRRLSARLDLQAGDGARRDGGAPALAVRVRSRARRTLRRRYDQHRSTTGTRSRTRR